MIEPASVTVVVPCYNSSNTLNRAIRSVLAQTVTPSALILVDDSSTDDTGEILKDAKLKHPELVQIITLPVNSGPSFARNAGWDVTTTEFVAFLDADDEWHPQKLEIMLRWFFQNPDAVFCSHPCVRSPSSPVEINTGEFAVSRFKFSDILISNRFSTPGVMLKTTLDQRFPVSLRYAEDYHLWLMLAAEVGYLDRIELPLACYFKEPYGESGLSGNLWAMQKGELSVLRDLREKGHLSAIVWAATSLLSLVKFAKRCVHLI